MSDMPETIFVYQGLRGYEVTNTDLPHSKKYVTTDLYEALQAKCERYERALETIASDGKGQFRWSLTKAEVTAREALNHKESQ